jgi:hypothetical protein
MQCGLTHERLTGPPECMGLSVHRPLNRPRGDHQKKAVSTKNARSRRLTKPDSVIEDYGLADRLGFSPEPRKGA